MRAISLWQPWATAVALGSKLVETRHWATDYRGPLVIHAAKRCNKSELLHYSCCWAWRGAMGLAGTDRHLERALPFGALVAVCDLVDCRPTEAFTVGELDVMRRPDGEKPGSPYEWCERLMGNFAPGRFGWVLENVRAFPVPVPWRGGQGFFQVPEAVVEKAFDLRAVSTAAGKVTLVEHPFLSAAGNLPAQGTERTTSKIG